MPTNCGSDANDQFRKWPELLSYSFSSSKWNQQSYAEKHPHSLANLWHTATAINSIGSQMAKPNYAFEKRQRDLAKKKKKEEKRLRKAEAKSEQTEENPSEPSQQPGADATVD